MKIGPSLAAGVAAGYVLGRTRKMKLALGLAVAGATGRMGVSPADLVERGLKGLVSSDVGKAAGAARGELLTAAKGLVTQAATSRVDDLTQRLTKGLSEPRAGRARDEDADEDLEYDEEETNGRRDDDYEDDEYAEGEEEPRRGRRPVVTRASSRRADDQDEADEDEGEEEFEDEEPDDEEEEERPARRTRSTSRRPARATAGSGTRSRR